MTTAITTTSFINSLGINTHIDSDADGYQNLATVESAINYLGIENIRDSAQTASDASAWLQVANATGAQFDDYIGETSPAGMATDLGFVSQLAQEGILNLLEGGNEEDDSYAIANGNSLAWTAQFQQQVWAMGQEYHLPVINMSFGSGWTAANNWEGDYPNVGDLSAYTNYANAHTYPNVGQTPDSTIQSLNSDAKLAASERQVITSEIGWQTSQFSLTEIAQFVVDATFDGIKDGDAGMWFYGLYDDSSGTWGLFNSDGSARPAATALHNLTTLLADSGANFTAGSLNYTLAGTQSGDNSFLMEKSNGSFWIGLWNEGGATHTVTVNLPSTATSISVFDPITGTTAIKSTSNASSISVSLGSDPLLIEIGGGSAPGSTGSSGSGSTSSGSTSTGSTSTGSTGASSPSDLSVTVPGSETVSAGATKAITGVSVSDAWAATAGGTMALNVWDKSGTLKIDGETLAPGGGPVSGGMFTGTLAQINADLATLSYTAAASSGADIITVDVWNQAGVEVQKNVAVTVSGSTSNNGGTSGSTAGNGSTTTITIAPTDASPVISQSDVSAVTNSGNHTIYVEGTGDTIAATGGTETVMAFLGGNTITTGSGNDTIRIAGSGNVVTAGTGANEIDDSGSGNRLVLPAAGQGTDAIYGYILQNADTLGLRPLLKATAWTGTASTVGSFVHVSTPDGSDAVISVTPSGAAGGASYNVATLEGAGAITLSTLLAHSII